MLKSPARGRSAKRGGALPKGGSQSPPPRTSRSVSPAGTVSGNNVLIDNDILEMLMKANLKDDDKDYKSIKIPLFSDGTEWEECRESREATGQLQCVVDTGCAKDWGMDSATNTKRARKASSIAKMVMAR